MEFQKMGPEDFLRVREFYWQTIEEMEGSQYEPGWEKGVYPTDAFLQEYLEKGELYALTEGDAVVGAMVLNHEVTDGYEKVHWQVDAPAEQVISVHALGTLPSYQGKGLGKTLVREAIRICGEMGQKAIRLDVLQNNLPAQKLYTSMGFRYLETLQLFYEDTGLTDFLMYEYLL